MSNTADALGLGPLPGTGVAAGDASAAGVATGAAGLTVPGSGQLFGQQNDLTVEQAVSSLEQLAGNNPGLLGQIQSDMYAAGYYGRYKPQIGIINQNDRNAFRNAVYEAALSGQTLGTFLDQAGSFAGLSGISSAGALIVDLPDPNDLTQIVNDTYQKYLGKGPTTAERASFIAGVNQQMRDKYAQAYAARDYARETILQNRSQQPLTPDSVQAEGGIAPSTFGRLGVEDQKGAQPDQSQAVQAAKGSGTITPNDPTTAFLAALRKNESTTYDWGNTSQAGAHGAYQFMPATWASAARDAGRNPNDHSPENQDYVARVAVTNLYNQFHDWALVAAAWNGGAGTAQQIQKKGWGYAGTLGDGNETVAQYVKSVMSDFNGGNMPANDAALAGGAGAGAGAGAGGTGGTGAGTGTGGVSSTQIGEPPEFDITGSTPNSDALAAAKTAHPDEFAATSLAGMFDKFQTMLRGPQLSGGV